MLFRQGGRGKAEEGQKGEKATHLISEKESAGNKENRRNMKQEANQDGKHNQRKKGKD